MTLCSSNLQSPIGPLTYFYGENKKVYAVFFETQKKHIEKYLAKHFKAHSIKSITRGIYDQDFKQYFKNPKHSLQHIPITVMGTKKQIDTWNTVSKIKTGHITSYKEIAKKVGNEKAVRSVGTAIGANPVCLIIPCHRVLTSNGSLGGYSGGVDKKAWLLKHESALK